MSDPRGDAGGFVAFYRRYTRTWIHALATAALTAFGTLTVLDRRFAVVAVAAYVLPPVALYLAGRSGDGVAPAAEDRPARATGDRSAGTAGDRPAETTESALDDEGAGPEDPGSRTADDRPGMASGPGWMTADVPADEALRDAVVADAGAYAVGAEGTVLVDEGEGWNAAVRDGPGAGSNALTGVDATDDGAVWFVGDGGAVGRLDPATGRHVDFSAPDGDTTNLGGVAVAGRVGDETVLLVDGSGRVRRGRYRDGEMAWDEPATPGSGSSIAGVALSGSTGYLCDTAGAVFAVHDGGRSFRRIGLEADGTLTDVAATGAGACLVGDDDGVVHRYDGTTWTPVRLDDDPVWALAVHDDRRTAARDDHWIAAGDGGVVYERAGDAADWDRTVTPASVPLRGVSLGSSRAVAVGDEGTIVERSLRPNDR